MHIPVKARRSAALGLLLHENGFAGGTQTGWDRAKQLSTSRLISDADARTIRNWFARHRHVSRMGYFKWIRDGMPLHPTDGNENKYRGAVSWLLWGGEFMYQMFF